MRFIIKYIIFSIMTFGIFYTSKDYIYIYYKWLFTIYIVLAGILFIL